jgi:hypothetical protein
MSELTVAEIRRKDQIVVNFPNGEELRLENDDSVIGPVVRAIRTAESCGVLADWVDADKLEGVLATDDAVQWGGTRAEVIDIN